MAKILSGKPIYFITTCYWDKLRENVLKYTWITCWKQQPYSDLIVEAPNQTKISEIIKATNQTELKDGSVLYFSKTSRFPRFKLNNTTFKRCIKRSKADCVVIGNFDAKQWDHRCILEGSKNYYVVQLTLPSYWAPQNTNLVSEYANDWYAFLKKRPYIFEENVCPTKIYEDVLLTSTKDPEIFCAIMNKEIPATIIDSDLDKIVSKSCDVPSEEDFKSIINMLESPDLEANGLGLRLLANYDITDVYSATKLILALNWNKLKETKEWGSVSVKQLVSKFTFYTTGKTNSAIATYLRINPTSELDTKLCTILLKSAIHIALDSTVDSINRILNQEGKFNIKVSLHIE